MAPIARSAPNVTIRVAIAELASQDFDLLVIGAGIHGAFAALEAARRGWRVALIDRGDYGAATSANSMRVLHGGFRYLKSGDLRRLRESARERDYLLAAAPHLTMPLDCMAPTGTAATPGPLAFRAALAMYGMLDARRNAEAHESRTLTRNEYEVRAGAFATPDASGGAVWQDGFLTGAERLLMNVVRTAQTHGATAANYASCERIIVREGMVRGAGVLDVVSGESIDVRARCILNAAGPWISDVVADLGGAAPLALARGCNAILRCPPPRCAVALPADAGRLLFAAPFAGLTLIGTWYSAAVPGGPSLADDVSALLAAANRAAPALQLGAAAVTRVHAGALPRHAGAAPDDVAGSLHDRPIVIDHGATGGARGLISLSGVKWTTARSAALRSLTAAHETLGAPPRHVSPDAPLHGWQQQPPKRDGATHTRGASDELSAHLAAQYGTAAPDVRSAGSGDECLLQPLAPDCPTVGAEIVHAIRAEQAVHLDDILVRRCGVGLAEEPSQALVRAAARLAATELGWSGDEMDREIAAMSRLYGAPR
jgi:glycerol-3-phosphate dehydrogenase